MVSESERSQISPGQELREAREQQGKTVEMIAQQLKLPVELVQALEKNEYEKFPVPVYARGHIRNYARLVHLDSARLVAAFDQQNKIQTPTLEPFASQPEPQVHSGDRHIRVVTYSLIAVLLLLLGLWWQSHRPSTEASLVVPSEIVEEPVDRPVSEKVADQQTLDVGSTAVQEPDMPQTPQPAEQREEEPEVLEHEFGIVYLSELPEPPQESSAKTVPFQPAVTAVPETGSGTVVPTQHDEATPIENEGIILQFTGESWIQITDANNKKIFSRLGKPDEVVHLDGTPPLHVVVGKASAVIMSYQGNFIDLEPLARNEVARFTLDEEGAHR